MRIPRLTHCLLALVCTLAGCTQTGGFRSAAAGNSNSNIRTVASIGDKPIPIVAGEPGLSQRPQTEELDLPASSGARISGRVYDDRGRPVPNARVRLAVGGSQSGKASYATTDRSGAFTLRGLRTGSYYTVIAEYEAQTGAMSGRIEAQAPDTNVRISLQSRDSDSDQAHSTIRPAKSRVESSVEDEEDETPDVRSRADRYNSEDVEPPAAEATSMLPRRTRNAQRLSGSDNLPPIRAGWNPRQRPPENDDGTKSQSRVSDDEPGSRSPRNSPVEPVEQDDDEGPNPLPPALGPRQVGSTFPGDSGDDPPLKIATVGSRSSSRARQQTASSRLEASDSSARGRDERARRREPRPMPEGVVPNSREMRPDSFAPIRGTDPADSDTAQGRSAPRTRRPSSALPSETRFSRSPAASDESTADDSQSAIESPLRPADTDGSRAPHDRPESAASRRPTWRDVSFNQNDVPLDESIRLVANHQEDNRSPIVTPTPSADGPEDKGPPIAAPTALANGPKDKGPPIAAPTASASRSRRSLFQRLGASKSTPATPVPSPSLCRVDPTDRRVVDLQMPALDGKVVSLHDIDADLVLLDFWGSWCRECRKSIPHLADLQAKYGQNRLRVIGIACERGSTAEERRASAGKAARALDINYSVLVSSMDGSCPVQKGMQVQFYPTMVLLDRSGKIIQREQGATDATLARIDRAIATALK
jgi:thiol-disulfide isomerase/thioredoxin